MEECCFSNVAGVQLKATLLHGCFSYLLNCTNGTKSRNALQYYLQIKFLNLFWQKDLISLNSLLYKTNFNNKRQFLNNGETKELQYENIKNLLSFVTFEEVEEKSAILKISAQSSEAVDFPNIFLSFLGFLGSFYQIKFSYI